MTGLGIALIGVVIIRNLGDLSQTIRFVITTICILLSALFLIGGMILIVLELNSTLGQFSIPIGLSLLAILLALTSDEKMRAIANELYLNIVGLLEDRRLELLKKHRIVQHRILTLQPIDEYMIDFRNTFSFDIWKGVTDIRRASKLRKWSSRLFQYELMKHVMRFLQQIDSHRLFYGFPLTQDNRTHIQLMLGYISEFKAYEDPDYRQVRDTLIQLRLSLTNS